MKKRVKLEDDTTATPLAQTTRWLKKQELSVDSCNTKLKVESKLEGEQVVLKTEHSYSKAAVMDSSPSSALSIISISAGKKEESDKEKVEELLIACQWSFSFYKKL